ncbi:acyltransferase [Ilumatobacter sp.]|uniref:acyltransferase n=1 Tax=Ilumatobacter sp. TaxID=1967498 RepID=UPI003AF7C40A
MTTIAPLDGEAPIPAEPFEAHVSPPIGATAAPAAGSDGRLASAERARTSIRGLWQSEVAQLRPALLVGSAVARVLPAHTAGRTRAAVHRRAGLAIGRGTVIAGALRVSGTSDPRRTLRIGRHCYVNTNCQVDASAEVTIGDQVYLSQDVCIITNTHVIGDAHQRAGSLTAAPVSIGDGTWVGARTTILPGVVIGAGSIVAAGAVVTADVRPDTIVAGVPARVVKRLDGAHDPAGHDPPSGDSLMRRHRRRS